MRKLSAALSMLVLFAVLAGAANTFVTQNLVVQQTSNLAAASATTIVASSTVQAPSFFAKGAGAGVTIAPCNASPPTSLVNNGSICMDETSGNLYVGVTSGGVTTWSAAQTGTPPSSSWALVDSDTLQLGSLTGYTQQHGVWTAPFGVGFQSDDGGAENYLSIDNGAPIPSACASGVSCGVIQYAMQVDVNFTAASTGTTACGVVLRGSNGAVSGGVIRALIQKDGTFNGLNVFSGGSFDTTSAAYTAGVWHTLQFTVYSLHADTTGYQGFVQMAVDGIVNGQFQPTGYGAITFTRVGLWANPAHCQFRNLKVWRPALAT